MTAPFTRLCHAIAASATALCCLTSCFSTTAEKKTPALMSQSMASRFTKPDLTRRSVYEASMQANVGKKDGIGSWFTGQKHTAKTFGGAKSFAGSRDFKTDAFSPAGQKSHMAGQGFAQRDKASAAAGVAFNTSESPYANQAAAESTQTFADADAVFSTRPNRDALRSQKKNKGPEFIELEEQSRTPAYTEDQVRRLLGRD